MILSAFMNLFVLFRRHLQRGPFLAFSLFRSNLVRSRKVESYLWNILGKKAADLATSMAVKHADECGLGAIIEEAIDEEGIWVVRGGTVFHGLPTGDVGFLEVREGPEGGAILEDLSPFLSHGAHHGYNFIS